LTSTPDRHWPTGNDGWRVVIGIWQSGQLNEIIPITTMTTEQSRSVSTTPTFDDLRWSKPKI
jgi:hypothetical protein